MNLQVLEYYLAVCREKSFSAAAEAIHISQPTLSRQIADLEIELGKKLFIRTRKQLQLTDEGMLLKVRAEEILSLVDKTEQEIAGNDVALTGDIMIGAAETPGIHMITLAAYRLQKEHPGIRIHISSGDRTDLSWQLDHGLADMAIVYGDVDHEKYNCITLPHQDVFGIYMRKDDPLSAKEKILPEQDLIHKPLIVNRNSHGYLIPGVPLQQFHIAGTYNLLYNAFLMAEDGIGYTVGLGDVLSTEGTALCFRPFKTEYRVSKYLIWKKNQILKKPMELLLDEVNKLIAEEQA